MSKNKTGYSFRLVFKTWVVPSDGTSGEFVQSLWFSM